MSNGTIRWAGVELAVSGVVNRAAKDMIVAMGGAISGASTDEFVTVPGMSNTVNAANFGDPADADEVKITAAVAYAKLHGKAFCLIPLTMQPFDASLVTFDPVVRMVREGNGVWDEYDAMAYGADAAFSAYSQAAMQAAADAAAAGAAIGGIRTVRVPPGQFGVTQPWWIKSQGMVILGSGQGYNAAGASPSRIDMNGVCGPIVYVQGSTATTTLTTSLATGPGQAFTSDRDTHWFNLRDCPLLDIHGLAQFTVRCFLQSSDADDPVSVLSIVTSHGTWLTNDTECTAFQLRRNTVSAGTATTHATLALSGGTVTLDGSTNIIDGADHVLELNYDGSTVRLFVDGSVDASAAGSGTVVQGSGEEVTTGKSFLTAPERGEWTRGLICTIDSLEIANTARNTIAYSKPTAKFAADSHTLILMNGTASVGACVKVETKNGIGWLHQRDSGLTGTTNGLRMKGLCVGSAGSGLTGVLMAGNTLDWRMEDMHLLAGRAGLYAVNSQSYQWSNENPFVFSNTGRYGIAIGGLGGIGHLNAGWIQGQQIGFTSDSGATSLTAPYFQNGTNTIFSLKLSNTGSGSSDLPSLRGGVCNCEAGVGTNYRGALALQNTKTHIHAQDWAFETGNNAPFVIADTIGGGRFDNCDFVKSGSTSEVMAVQGASPITPVVFGTSPFSGGFVQYSATAGAATAAIFGRMNLTFTTTPTFDFSKSSEWTLGQLTDNVTAQTWQNAGDGQPIVVRYQQNASAAKTVAAPSNVIGWTAISATLGSISEFRGSYDQGLGKFVGSMFAGLT